MSTIHQSLIKQVTDEAQHLPEDLVREVLDFIGYLRVKYEQNGEEDRPETHTDQPKSYHDLDDLAGTWTPEEAASFEMAVADFETVDESIWP